MIHPFFIKLASQPGLFAEHIGAYAELAVAEAREFGANWQTRALLVVIAAFTGAIALVVSAVAAMMVAAHGWYSMPAPWVLVAVPALFWLITFCCAFFAWRLKVSPMFSLVREQLGADIELLHRAGNA